MMTRINLRQLILALTLIAVLVTLANGLYSSNRVQRDILLETTLEANHTYASKLAQATDVFLDDAMAQLEYSAGVIMGRHGPGLFNDEAAMQRETDRLRMQAHSFNSVQIVNEDRRVLAVSIVASPASLPTHIESEGALKALAARAPSIGTIYRAPTGRRVLLLSWPLFDQQNNYRGYVGGTIYVDEPNVLQSLLGRHFYSDDSSLFVIDRTGTVIYHRDGSQVGKTLSNNAAVNAILAGYNGYQRLIDGNGQDVLAGYAVIKRVGWGIVAQRPAENVLINEGTLLRQTLVYTLPLFLILIIGIWWVSRHISHPLALLARRSRHMNNVDATRNQLLSISAWYFESAQLKQSLLHSLALINTKLRQLRHESATDQLTGLTNRRGLEYQVTQWIAEDAPFALLLLDVDFFKTINDTHGHDVGDQVLRHVATLIRENSRGPDLPCRTGGEEFALFLPGTSAEVAYRVAERLRRRVAETAFPNGISITISIGIALYPDDGATLQAVTKMADDALYAAKRNGRNRIEPALDHPIQPE